MQPTPRALLALACACSLLASASFASSGELAAATSRDWSDPPDFEALRAELSARPDFKALCEAERPLTEAFETMQAERWSDLFALAAPWAARCPIDLEAHTFLATALAHLGEPAAAEAHDMWARGLFEAALATGDGKTPETPYRVIAEFEEYALLRMFRYAPERQQSAPNGIDAMTVSADGEPQTIYFEPAAHAAARIARLEGGSAQR
jgi:Domain of unknown function (DUF4919)